MINVTKPYLPAIKKYGNKKYSEQITQTRQLLSYFFLS